MRSLQLASIVPELPSVPGGIGFLEAATRRRCLWPLSGAGADMQVCGEVRADLSGNRYCAAHRRASAPPGG